MRLLIVEDNASLSALLSAHLRGRGFQVDAVGSGAAALTCAAATDYNAVILDLGLPDMDGLEVLRRLRAGSALPALILTARDSVAERVAGLDAGADDYILKPFETAELDARLRAVLRRPGARMHPVHQFADLSFDSATRTASHAGRPIDLTPREANVFEALIRAGANIVVRDALGEDASPNALEATMSRLRRKLANAGSDVRIETLRGIGYRLNS